MTNENILINSKVNVNHHLKYIITYNFYKPH